jgi:translation initiation factor IF-3
VKVEIKEIRFGPQTDEHDYNFKLKHAKEFLMEGDKVKAHVFFRGRSILFKEQGEVLLLRFANDLEEVGKVESMPKLEGKRMIIYIAPKSVKKASKPAEHEEADAENVQKAEKKAPQQKAKKEFTLSVEGEDF